MKKNDKITEGLVPPQLIEMEASVLGSCLLNMEAVTISLDILTVDSFFDPKHQVIFKAILSLFEEGDPIDILTVNTYCIRNFPNQVPITYISKLTDNLGTTGNVEYHARCVAEMHIKRQIINASSISTKEAYDMSVDAFDALTNFENKISQISQTYTGSQYMNASELAHISIQEIEEAMKSKGGITGVPTGFKELDQLTSGWQRSDMIVIAARPAMGKTAFMLSAARNAAVIFEKPVAIFSLEMSSSQLFKRLISAESNVSSNGMRSGKLTDSDLNQIHSRIHNLSVAPIYIDDTPSISINQLKAKSIKMKKLHGIELIIIDYLQLMSGGEFGGNREQEISSISRAIKTLAKELNVPIIALSQLSRSVETRGGDKKPMLSDLRESGAIEQDADMVCFLYRPEYYGFLNDESGESTIGKAEIIIAKHRNGSVDSAKLKYVAQFTRFENLDGETIVNTNVKSSINPNQDLKPNNDFDADDYNLVDELPF